MLASHLCILLEYDLHIFPKSVRASGTMRPVCNLIESAMKLEEEVSRSAYKIEE